MWGEKRPDASAETLHLLRIPPISRCALHPVNTGQTQAQRPIWGHQQYIMMMPGKAHNIDKAPPPLSPPSLTLYPYSNTMGGVLPPEPA